MADRANPALDRMVMIYSEEPPYVDRRAAGRELAKLLTDYRGRNDVVVLALPRGGVPVGDEIATALGVPLDALSVRKLGVPGHRELAFGAIASGGVRVLNRDVVFSMGDEAQAAIDSVTASELAELQRREALFRGQSPPLSVSGKTVLLVDDGLATGATMRAAVQALRKMEAARIVVVVPVGPPDTCAVIEMEADGLVCPIQPRGFMSVGQYYGIFDQTSDAEVREILIRHHGAAAP